MQLTLGEELTAEGGTTILYPMRTGNTYRDVWRVTAAPGRGGPGLAAALPAPATPSSEPPTEQQSVAHTPATRRRAPHPHATHAPVAHMMIASCIGSMVAQKTSSRNLASRSGVLSSASRALQHSPGRVVASLCIPRGISE